MISSGSVVAPARVVPGGRLASVLVVCCGRGLRPVLAVCSWLRLASVLPVYFWRSGSRPVLAAAGDALDAALL